MLKAVSERLRKAYSLPESEQVKWGSKIKELETQADHEAVELLIGMNRKIASIFICKEEGKFNKFLLDNKKVNNYLLDAEKELNLAYQIKDWDQYLKSLEKYKVTMITAIGMFNECETKGYRDILPKELDVNVQDLFSGRG